MMNLDEMYATALVNRQTREPVDVMRDGSEMLHFAQADDTTAMATEMAAGTEPEGTKPMTLRQFGETAADVPAGLLKGAVQGTAGLPGDIESLASGVKDALPTPKPSQVSLFPVVNAVRQLSAIPGDALDRFLKGLEEETIMPTTEDVKKWLDTNVSPLVPEGADPRRVEAAKTAEFVGELGGAGQTIIEGSKAAVGAARQIGQEILTEAPVGAIRLTGRPLDLQPGSRVEEGNKIGVEPALRVRVAMPDREMPEKPLLVLSTDERNVDRQLAGIDEILAQMPEPQLTQESWAKSLAYAFKSNEVPVPPYAIINSLQSPDRLAAPLRTLTQGQIDDATAGFQNASQFKQLYVSGQADPVTTGKLFLWSFLSRGVSPYVQEGLFLDAINGVEPFLRRAASGQFTETDLEEYLAWASTVASKGTGQPGSGAMHNLNAFGKNFLTKMSRPGADGVTGLQKIHDMMANPDMTGPQIRREFARIGAGVGIDNKVVSFTLLVSGRDDVLVIDRVQLKNLWDDGRFGDRNLWDGRKQVRMVRKADGTSEEKSAQIAGTALSEITYGAKGILVYEMLERAIAAQIKEAYRLVGREQDASLGRFHWETWVAASEQEAGHGTIDAILRQARGEPDAMRGVTAKQGEYGMYDYGARYGTDESGGYFLYDDSQGNAYRFTVPEFRDMLETIKKPAAGVVPTKFKVSQSGSAPWFTRPEVNRERLDEIIAERGRPVSGSAAVASTGEQPVRPASQGQTANRTRSRATGTRTEPVTRGAAPRMKGGK
jgi:hypothetical protein